MLQELIHIDANETAQLVLQDFAAPLGEIVRQMEVIIQKLFRNINRASIPSYGILLLLNLTC